MHSYVNHSKTAKKIDIQPSAVISPNKPNSRVLLTKQQTRLTKRTTGWRWEETDLEWKLKLSDRKKEK